MSAVQDGFDSNGPTVEIKAGETKTADVALIARPDKLRSELVDFDTLYPPGPTRDYLMKNCMGCHGYEHIPWHRMQGEQAATRMFGQPRSAACLTWTAPAPPTIPAFPR